LIALAASIDSSQPLLFVGWPDVSDDAVPRLRLRIQALTADAERMPVGEAFEAQADWAAEGVTLDFGRITIDGAADPIIPGAPIEADVRLTFQGTEPPCGIIEGNIIQPAAVPLDGTWGSVAVDAGAYAGVELITRCP
jgi:hypothetical protein